MVKNLAKPSYPPMFHKTDYAPVSINTLAKLTHPLAFIGQKADPHRSLYVFSENNIIRKVARSIIDYKWFEMIVIVTIAANCVSLAMEIHLPMNDKNPLVIKMAVLEPIFLGIFTAECLLKVIAMGFIMDDGSYLRSIWNILDFIVVAAGLLTVNLSSDTNIDLRTFRAIRVLRPLKLVSGIPSLQVVLTSIIKAMKPLLQIGLLVLFAIVIFAITGLELYRGNLHFTCFEENNTNIDFAIKQPCLPNSNTTCKAGYVCRPYWDGPFFGMVNFDNIGYAMLTVFQCITMEGWTDIMYTMNKATESQLNAFYFVTLIVFGSFFMLNLILGVLSGEFAKERERVEKRQAYLKMRDHQRNQEMIEGYLQWIETAEELEFAEDKLNLKKNKKKKLWKKNKKDGEMEGEDDSPPSESCCNRVLSTLCCGGMCLRELRLVVRHLTKTQLFYWTVIILVLLNTVCVAMEHYNQPPFLDEFLFYTDFFFLTLFLMEMLLKLFGLGVKEYFRSKFNTFDFIVVAFSVFEIIFQIFQTQQSFGFSALRCIRLLRLLKLTRYWPSLRNLVLSLLSSMRSILSLLMLLGLFIFILTLLGMQLFGGDFNFDSGTPTLNFDTFVSALITVFVILTGENWNEIMYDGIRSQIITSSQKDNAMFYSAYFLLIVVFGNYTLLNVFLAIAVDNLANAAELSAAEEEEKEEHAKKMEEAENEELRKLLGGPVVVPELDLFGDNQKMMLEKPLTLREELSQTCGITLEDTEENEDEQSIVGRQILPYSSLFIFAPDSWVRRFSHFIVNLRYFDIFIMMVIFASSIALAAEDPVLETSLKNTYLEYFDIAFTVVFLLELLLKVIDLGLIFHPGSYMRDIWNLMDMFVVIVAVFSFLYSILAEQLNLSSRNLNTIKSLRVLRVLRPLKTINRVPKLKAVFDTVISSVKNVVNILIVFVLFQFIFAVVAVQLFKGKFFHCTDLSKRTINVCQGYFIDYSSTMIPKVQKRIWQRYCFHFDDLFYSMITLFTVTTGEGWPTVLEHSMFSTYQNEGPIRNYSQQMFIFYIVFFVVFPFFFVNIFVALIIITFQQQGAADLSDPDIDQNVKKCIDFAINSEPFSTHKPENRKSICYKMWVLVESPPFETFIMILIALNSVTLVLKSHSRFPEHTSAANENTLFSLVSETNLCQSLKFLNIAFTILFTLECLMKLVAYKFKNYFKDKWNIFDLITVIGSILDVAVSELKSEENPTDFPNLGFLRLFRALRLIKVLRRGTSIRILLWTFIQSFKALPWVCLLIGLLFFIYSIIGMQVFGNIVLDDDTQINLNNNFQSFFSGILLLFRCATGESWHQIMLDTDANKTCACSRPTLNNGCLDEPGRSCGSDMAYPYFVTFILVTTFLMLNLFVAVIMDNFDYLTRDSSILGPHHLDEFLRVWALYDPQATGKLHYTDMYKVVRKLDPPLGFGLKCPNRAAYMKLIRMNQIIDEDMCVNFNSTLFALIRESLQIKMGPADTMDEYDQQLRITMMDMWPRLQTGNKIDTFVALNKASQRLTVGKIYAAVIIRENYLNYKKWLRSNPHGKEELFNAMRAQATPTDDSKDTHLSVPNIKYRPRTDSDAWLLESKRLSVQPLSYSDRGLALSEELYGRLEAMLHEKDLSDERLTQLSHRSISPTPIYTESVEDIQPPYDEPDVTINMSPPPTDRGFGFGSVVQDMINRVQSIIAESRRLRMQNHQTD